MSEKEKKLLYEKPEIVGLNTQVARGQDCEPGSVPGAEEHCLPGGDAGRWCVEGTTAGINCVGGAFY